METRTRGMRKAKEKSTVQSTELTTERKTRNTVKAAKLRVPLQDMPANNNTFDPKMTKKCSVVLQPLSTKVLESPMRRSSQNSETENIYDFEESPSQEEIIAPNDEMNEVLKNLQKKNIVKVAKRKPKINKEKTEKPSVKAKTASKKRKAPDATTKTSAVAKKQKTHNLDDVADEFGGNEAEADDNFDGRCSVQSVYSDIIDQNGDVIGLIEKEWSETRTLRQRKPKTDDVTTATSSTKVNNSKVKIVDTIEPYVERAVTPIEEPFPDIPNDVFDTPEPETQLTAPPIKRRLRNTDRNKPEQSTPITSRVPLNKSDIFKNASPVISSTSGKIATPKSLLNVTEIENDANSVEALEPSPSKIEKPKHVYGRSPLKNISNSNTTKTPSSSTLFDQQKNATDLNKNSFFTIALPKQVTERLIVEKEAPAMDKLFGFDDDVIELDDTGLENDLSRKSLGDKNALVEKRNELKRFLKNPVPNESTNETPKKHATPVKARMPAGIFGNASNAQKDIRSALNSHENHKPVDNPSNLFSDTETEMKQDRRKSYTRTPKQYKRQLVADSEHEDDEEEEEEAEERAKKAKKSKAKPRKKVVNPKEKSAEEEELDKFAKEINSEFEEVEKFDLLVVPE